MLPPAPFGEPMCNQCIELQRKIDQFGRALSQPLDPVTEERISAGLAELKKRKSEKHPRFEAFDS
jgi:hypothetical protein